jgi:hypothetical protein
MFNIGCRVWATSNVEYVLLTNVSANTVVAIFRVKLTTAIFAETLVHTSSHTRKSKLCIELSQQDRRTS